MASIARINIARLGYNHFTRQLCKITAVSNVTQVAFITSKAKRVDRRPRLKPYDYLNKNYGFWDQLFDPMLDRLDDNSRVIVIEGPIAAGKTKFAQQLADELEMVYLPPPTFDEYYITDYGYDLRTLDDKLSRSVQSCDVQRFLTDPHHPNVPMFQFHYFQLRFDQYITTLLHLLSTGQGVILNRSFYTNYIFAKAMTNAGYMRPQALKFHNDVVNIAKSLMMRPHLIIYLDVPVDVTKERIKQRGIPYEMNSKVLTTDYLTDMEKIYKHEYLKEILIHSHVLIYDWTDEGDIKTVVEDIEALNFDHNEKTDKKMEDWRFEHVILLRHRREYYQNRYWLHRDYVRHEYEVPELTFSGDECKELYTTYLSVPGERFSKGFNRKLGDKGIWSKVLMKTVWPHSIRNHPRELEVIREELKKLKANAMR